MSLRQGGSRRAEDGSWPNTLHNRRSISQTWEGEKQVSGLVYVLMLLGPGSHICMYLDSGPAHSVANLTCQRCHELSPVLESWG
jgi:hypothetical protein